MTPAEELRAAAATLRERAAAVLVEIGTNPYWGGDLANFSEGVKNACGGAGGDLAALFTPHAADWLALLLEDQAGMYEDFAPRDEDIAERVVWHALGVARAINAEATS